jgi:RNA 3'-terminal phosphate cyclase (ATP)
MADRARSVLTREGFDNEVHATRERGPGPGAALFLETEYEHVTIGFSALGERGKPAERVAEEACEELLIHHGSAEPFDRHLADQLLVPMAMASGPSEFRTSAVTRHLLTNAYVIDRFGVARILIEGREGEPGKVRVEPCGEPGQGETPDRVKRPADM